MVTSPLRRLQGITYWVIENPEDIYDFINTNVRVEWEADIEFAGGNPREDPWLKSLPNHRWRLGVMDTNLVRLNPFVSDFTDSKKSYSFAESLARRIRELRKAIENYGSVIWPIVVDGRDLKLVDGYCRLTTLKEMGISETYAYTGTIRTDARSRTL